MSLKLGSIPFIVSSTLEAACWILQTHDQASSSLCPSRALLPIVDQYLLVWLACPFSYPILTRASRSCSPSRCNRIFAYFSRREEKMMQRAGPPHPNMEQQQQLKQQHYHYHNAQHPQALSLAPPSGKGFFDVESLEQTAASNNLGLGHLGIFQPDYVLSSYTSGAVAPSSSSAAALPSHHLMPSHSPGQLWSRNSTKTHSGHVVAAQNLHYASAQAASATTHSLHSAGYSTGTHAYGDEHTAQLSSLHGWAGSESHRPQWPQYSWDNCFPPGVEPSATSAPNAVYSHMHTPVQGHTHSQTQLHPHSSVDLQTYRPLQHYTPHRVNVGAVRPPQKLWPKKKPAKVAEGKISVVKPTVNKETGAARGLAPENGPGWCSVCQRNCVTEVALKQHLEGKGHRRQVERQKVKSEPVAKTAVEDGGVANMLEKVWMQVSMMSKPARIGKPKRKPKVEEAGKDAQPKKRAKLEEGGKGVQPTDVQPNVKGDPEITKSEVVGNSNSKGKVVEMVRCELCNVECNSQAVLEIHFGGKKHAARLKKLQEPPVA